LGAGSVIHAMHHEQDIMKMGGLRKKLPITHITFLIGCIAIAGLPPFAGFFSKDEILAAAHDKHPVYYILGVTTSLMTAFYMFRLYFLTFSGKFRGTAEQEHHLHESPFSMTLPLMLLALLSIVGGWIGIPAVFAADMHWLSGFLSPVVPTLVPHHVSHEMELMLMGAVVLLVIIMIIIAFRKFGKDEIVNEAPVGLSKILANKWYVDELYQAVIVKPIEAIAAFFNKVLEARVIDGMVNGVGKAVQFSSRQLRLVQSGQVGSYVLIMVTSIILFLIFQLFWKS